MAVLARSDWSAGPQRAGTIRTPVSRHYLHHSVTPMWVGASAARNLQRIARERGFLDISYSQLADRAGNEIEGRGWGRQGAHTKGYNSTSHALCLVGNFESGFVPDAMVRGAARICRRHRPYGPGRITHPHSAVSSTACPGRHARAQIAAINAGASTGTPPPPGGSEMDMDEATFRKILRQELERRETPLHWMSMALQDGPGNKANYVARDIRHSIKPDVSRTLNRVREIPTGLEVLNGLIWAAENLPFGEEALDQLRTLIREELAEALAERQEP